MMTYEEYCNKIKAAKPGQVINLTKDEFKRFCTPGLHPRKDESTYRPYVNNTQ